jgi:hypothetical protein
MSETDLRDALLEHAERQTKAQESIRAVLVALAWALGTVTFLALVVAYLLAVA